MKQKLKRFDVILVDFGDDFIGSEQGGIRPAIIIQNDIGNLHSSNTIVFPCSTKMKNINQSTHTLIMRGMEKGLTENTLVLGELIRVISEKRIKKFLGRITDVNEQNELFRIKNAI